MSIHMQIYTCRYTSIHTSHVDAHAYKRLLTCLHTSLYMSAHMPILTYALQQKNNLSPRKTFLDFEPIFNSGNHGEEMSMRGTIVAA